MCRARLGAEGAERHPSGPQLLETLPREPERSRQHGCGFRVLTWPQRVTCLWPCSWDVQPSRSLRSRLTLLQPLHCCG